MMPKSAAPRERARTALTTIETGVVTNCEKTNASVLRATRPPTWVRAPGAEDGSGGFASPASALDIAAPRPIVSRVARSPEVLEAVRSAPTGPSGPPSGKGGLSPETSAADAPGPHPGRTRSFQALPEERRKSAYIELACAGDIPGGCC